MSSPSRRELFRKTALDRLSAPQELDALIAVTQPRGWLALVAGGLLLVAALTWGIVGRVHVEVRGTGVFVRQQVFHIAAVEPGQVTDVKVQAATAVRAGDVIALTRAASAGGSGSDAS